MIAEATLNGDFIPLSDVLNSHWITVTFGYEIGDCTHVLPNEKGHTINIGPGDDCLVESRCDCEPTYELADDNETVIVIHNRYEEIENDTTSNK